MQRDMELIRKILKKIEESEYDLANDVSMQPLYDEGYQEKIVTRHVDLLVQRNLVEAIDISSGGDLSYYIQGLTWDGHEFLSSAKNDTIWKKAKSIVIDKTGGLSFEVLKGVLIQLGKKAIDTES